MEIQAELAVSICDLIRRDPPSAFNLAYSEALLLLELPKTDSLISDLLDDCDAILDVSGEIFSIQFLKLKYIIVLLGCTQ